MSIAAEIVATTGVTAHEISRKKGWALLQEWRGIYCAPLHAATGRWAAGGYSCHTFSSEHFPWLNGHKAHVEYKAQSVDEFVILSEGKPEVALRCAGPVLPDFTGLMADIFVAPVTFDWTIVFTHENGLGPYFSRAEWTPSARP